MIEYKEMSKKGKRHVIVMTICGIICLAGGIIIENILISLIGLIFISEILDTYVHEDDKKMIEEQEYMLDKYNELVWKQNMEIIKLRKEKRKNNEKTYKGGIKT